MENDTVDHGYPKADDTLTSLLSKLVTADMMCKDNLEHFFANLGPSQGTDIKC